MHTIDYVRAFHKAFGHPIADSIQVPPPGVRLLRFKLLFEEVMEFGRAIGISGLCEQTQKEFEEGLKETLGQFEISETAAVDLTEAADALGDIDYVCAGANLVFGFPAQAVMREIHRANMSKLDADGRPVLDPVSKRVLKSDQYVPPDVAGVLAAYASGTEAALEDSRIYGPR